MITDDMMMEAVRAFLTASRNLEPIDEAVRRAIEAAEAAAWLPYDEDKVTSSPILLYWPDDEIGGELHGVGYLSRTGGHVWHYARPDPPTHYRLIVGPQT